MRGVNTQRSWTRVCRHMREHNWPADALMLTGDLAQDEVAPTYQRLAQQLHKLELPVFALPGNHDNPALLQQHLNDAPLSCAPVQELGNWRFVLLNTRVPGNPFGYLDEPQLAWLRDLLQATKDRHVAIWLHHPPVAVGCYWLDGLGLTNANALLDVIRGTRVRGIFCGHVHQQLDTYIDDVLITTTPSTCAQFLPRSYDFALDTRGPAYRRYRFAADGGIDTDVIWLTAIHDADPVNEDEIG